MEGIPKIYGSVCMKDFVCKKIIRIYYFTMWLQHVYLSLFLVTGKDKLWNFQIGLGNCILYKIFISLGKLKAIEFKIVSKKCVHYKMHIETEQCQIREN